MEQNQLAVRDGNLFIAPVVNVQGALQRYQDMKDFIEGILRKDVDYGVIPGTGKPTLLKPGAEKLSTFFGLSTQFEIIEKVEDWTGENHGGESFFNYWYKCKMTRNGSVVAEGEGSCNSFEKKYRWRSANVKCPACGNETIIKGKTEYGGGWICFAKKGGCGAKFKDGDPVIEDQPRGQVKNPDIADIVNTLQKMAQKRAYVAAVLLATNASEYFTQDVEDYIEADFVAVEPEHKHPSIVETAKELGGVPSMSMTYETACEVTNSKGTKYGDLTNEELSSMTIGINKGLKKPDLKPELVNEYRLKLDAIKVILQSRQ